VKTSFVLSAILTSIFLGGLAMSTAMGAEDAGQRREKARKAFHEGNFRDAYEALRGLLLDKSVVPATQDLNEAVASLQRLNRLAETDELLEVAVKTHQGDRARWWFLWHVANQYHQIQHQGFIVAGKFSRGPHRGGGRMVNTLDRDRVRALQLMVQALPDARKDNDHAKVARYLQAMAQMWMTGRYGQTEAWRLQAKTDLAVLPDYEDGWGYYWGGRGGQTQGAPVDEQGAPVFYSVPKTFEAAQSDGQRWRWCLEQAIEFNPALKNDIRLSLADFLHDQFGVQTMAASGWRFGREASDDSQEEEQGVFALTSLGEDETIARLATGIKRFKLPEEFNYISIYKQVADDAVKSDVGASALERLARIFENRRQYPKAADYWRRLIQAYPDAKQVKDWQRQLEQIESNWGRFEPVMTQPAGQGATVEYRFRNGTAVELEAHEIKVSKLLDDVKAYIKGRPQQLDWQKMNLGDLGYRLVIENQKEYLGEKVASWRMEIKPRPQHFDKRVTVATPLQKAGAYLVKAQMVGGNTSYVILWLNDTSIAKKALDQKAWYFVADAVTGAPVPKANVEFFGWQQRWQAPNRVEILVKDFAEFTDAEGQLIMDAGKQPGDYQWLIIATTPQGRLAYLGFTGVWYANRYDATYNETKVYTITDRPVYRPDQPVKYKFWVDYAKYDLSEEASAFAGHSFLLEIHNPKGEKVLAETKKADQYGGFDGQWKVPADATLGVYSVIIKRQGIMSALMNSNETLGGGTFRVEEYKKPEFEVTVDAPAEPVMLGEKIEAKITAKYYFGSPVTKAKVKYKIERTAADERWYPPAPWDWLYGEGYWWFACDYDWYPGWHRWGCWRPVPFWWPRAQLPPELVAEREVEIGADGTVKVEIDTAVAKAIHGDQDHRYSITAEVVDASRRTIVGSGNVLVARRPFAVHAWVDRGYYRVGDTIHAGLAARRLDGKPVEGRGELTLLKISYKQGKLLETPVQTWKLDTNAEGQAQQQLTASRAGQYRLSYKVTDRVSPRPPAVLSRMGEGTKGPHPNPLPEGEGTHTIEGGYVFTIIGEGFDSAQFRFNHLELVPDKADYAPGDKVKLQINTDRTDSTVLLFARPTNGVYLKPTLIHLDGKSTVREIEVVKRDMPNFFVEAVTIADGRVYTETREIVVPPENRVLNIDVKPLAQRGAGVPPAGKEDVATAAGAKFEPATEFKPGQKAKVQLKLTDYAGKPFVGSTVIAIYDKSIEYISGGSNVPEIKEFFWKWRRSHNPATESNLGGYFGNIVPRNALPMNDLGVFGGSVAEDPNAPAANDADEGGQGGPGGMGGGGGMMLGGFAGGKGAMQNRGVMEAESAAAPMDAMAAVPMALAPMKKSPAPTPAGQPLPMVQPTLRTKFADTALWVGQLTTASNGTAEVELNMPENLTTWRIKVWGMGFGTRVGQGQTDVVTRKDLIVRLEAPRFFVQTDEVVLSAVVHNYLKTGKKVEVSCEETGRNGSARLQPILEKSESPIFPPGDPWTRTSQVEVPAGGEARVDWRVHVLDEGQATIRMKALTDEESDAMEQKFPCYIHGMLKMEARSGVIRGKQMQGAMTFDVPEKRRPTQSRLEVRYSPTLAGAMVDALPYLVDYPYGCTEQTLNRFLPTVITQKVLLGMKLNLAEIHKKRTNLNAQEIGDDSERAKQWKRYDRNPVFDEDEVRRMVKDGVNRLTEMQLSDGGWGWFSGFGEYSSPHTTALVVHGLQVAKSNDVALVPGMLEKGVEWLRRYQDEQVQWLKNAAIEKKPDGLRWKEHADEQDAFDDMILVAAGVKNAEMRDFLYRDRTKIAVYGLAMFGIALQQEAEKEKLAMVMQNINQYVQQDNENQTAWLNLPEGCWWYWYGSEYEAEAYYLKLLCRSEPKGELASRLVKYLLNNRKNASYWNSTRDTAIVVEAMAEYVKASGESRPEMTVEVFYDGKQQKAVEITPQTVFSFDNKFVLEGEAVTAGKHEVVLKRTGAGPLYYNGYQTNFTLEDFITKAGLEIKVQRKYYKLVKVDKSIGAAGSRGQVVRQKVEKYDRRELENLATLTSGDLVEIELEIDSKNDYEYLVFEDMKPAGFEPVDQQGGYTGNDLGAYVEYRDNRVVFFARTLARGKHSVAYRMRAETPGRFSALPTRAWAMYAPELKANSDEIKLKVKD
jgi:uncharacterized protein YfaS (alpha-2-macroglobulin family)